MKQETGTRIARGFEISSLLLGAILALIYLDPMDVRNMRAGYSYSIKPASFEHTGSIPEGLKTIAGDQEKTAKAAWK